MSIAIARTFLAGMTAEGDGVPGPVAADRIPAIVSFELMDCEMPRNYFYATLFKFRPRRLSLDISAAVLPNDG